MSHLRAARTRSDELHAVLADTAAPPDVAKQDAYISDLESQLAAVNKRLRSLNLRREPDLQDHVKYRDSTFRRLAFKATGQGASFEEKAAAMENEYLEGVKDTVRQDALKEEIVGLLDDAKVRREELQDSADRHIVARNQLDILYDDLFAGLDPDYPEENAAQDVANIALNQYHTARTALDADIAARPHLDAAAKFMRQSLEAVQYALNLSASDVWGNRGLLSDLMKRSELKHADRDFRAALAAYDAARGSSARVPELPALVVQPGNLEPSYLLDNIFTSASFRSRIKQVDADMRGIVALFAQIRHEHLERIAIESDEIVVKQTTLSRARVALQEVRRRIILASEP